MNKTNRNKSKKNDKWSYTLRYKNGKWSYSYKTKKRKIKTQKQKSQKSKHLCEWNGRKAKCINVFKKIYHLVQ